MRNKLRFGAILAVLGFSIVLVSCGSFGGKKSKKSGKSSTTGWNYNDPNMGGFTVASSKEQKVGPGLVAIEGGTFTMGATQENVSASTSAVCQSPFLPCVSVNLPPSFTSMFGP